MTAAAVSLVASSLACCCCCSCSIGQSKNEESRLELFGVPYLSRLFPPQGPLGRQSVTAFIHDPALSIFEGSVLDLPAAGYNDNFEVVIDLRVLGKSFPCEGPSCYVGNLRDLRKSFFRGWRIFAKVLQRSGRKSKLFF